MKESVKQEIYQLVEVCDDDEALENARQLLLSAVTDNNLSELSNEHGSAPDGKKDSLNEIFGLWKNRNISLSEIREQQWQRETE